MSDVMGRTSHVCIACHDFRAGGADAESFSTRGPVLDFLRRSGFRVVSRPDDPRPYVRDHLHAVREA